MKSIRKSLRFNSFSSFSDYLDKEREVPGFDDTNCFYAVENSFNGTTCFDGTVSCSKPETALRRLAKAFPQELSWINNYLEDDSYLGEGRLLPDCESYMVEFIDDHLWYVAARICTPIYS